jgi:biopolymer transport protein ExbD
MGSIDDTAKLSAELVKLFREREVNRAYRAEMLTRLDLPEASRIERTVFIRAQRSVPYGDVMKVIDGIKGGGANPIGLQIDNLN